MAERRYFFQVGGTLTDDAPSYVERPADSEILAALERGDLCLVLAPRQTGKSSLMVHTKTKLLARGTRAGIVDLQSLGSETRVDQWFGDVTYQVGRSLELDTDALEWWAQYRRLGPTQRFMTFLEDVVLAVDETPVVLFFDEVDSVLNLPFSDDFFTTLRALYNARSTNRNLRRLTFVLLGVATPASFVKSRTRTPFNVGYFIELSDFEKESVNAFYEVLGEDSVELVDRIFDWTEGQPFLVQDMAAKVYAWAPKERTREQLDRSVKELYLEKKIDQDTHLKDIRDYLLGVGDTRAILETYKQVLLGKEVIEDERSSVHTCLKLSGVVREKDGKLHPRNPIYRSVFDLEWVRENLRELWNVPPRNPFFTGRDDVLDALYRALTDGSRTGLGQAITGLGGIGKTQIAIEFCHRYRNDFKAVFWVRAETVDQIKAGFVEIAKLLDLPAVEAEADASVIAVQRWLSFHAGWLLVFNNADQPVLLKPFLPTSGRGQVLITSRATALTALSIREPFRLSSLTAKEAEAFLLDRASRPNPTEDERAAAIQLAGELGHFPLALEQAAAYVAASGARFRAYLESYCQRQLALLEETPPVAGNYEATVATTWSMSFREIEEESPASADVLCVLAFFAPDAIPLEIFEVGAAKLGERIAATVGKGPLELLRILEPLSQYSFVEHDMEGHTVNVHRMIQEVTRARLGVAEGAWAERVVKALDQVFPGLVEFESWPLCQRLYPHVLEVGRLVDRLSIELSEAAHLFTVTGFYAWRRATYGEAELLYQRALLIREKTLGSDHPDIGTSLNHLAILYADQGRYEEAEPLYQRALAIRKKTLSPNHPDVGTSLNNLANFYKSQGRYEEAETLYQRALTIWERALGSDHPDVGTSLNNLAILYGDQGRYEEAEPLYQRALAIREKALGLNHPDTGASLNGLAILYTFQGRYREAESLYQRALAIWEKAFGPDHPDVASSLNNLAILYAHQGHYEEAKSLYQRALAIREKSLGPDHPDVGISLNNLATLYSGHGYHEEAEPLYQRALAIREKALGPDHPDVDVPAAKTGMGADVMNAYALLIAVGRCRYSEWSLPISTLDARELKKTLSDSALCAYPAERIWMLSDEAATREGILSAVDDLARAAEANPDATFLVYYSGHGWRQNTDDGGHHFLIPHDVKPHELTSTALPAEDFIQRLRNVRGRRVLVLMDTCHASAMAGAKSLVAESIPKGFEQERLPEALVAELGTGEGRAVFFSCGEAQKSWILPGEGSLSIFTHHLLKALNGAGSSPEDTKTTVSSLMRHLCKGVPESARRIGQEQTPYFKLDSQDFPVALIRGGKGLPVESDEVAARKEPSAPSGSSINIGSVTAGRNVVVAHKVGNVG